MIELPFPEPLSAIAAQFALVRVGRKPAVLLTCGQPWVDLPADLLQRRTPAGVVVAKTPEALEAAARAVEDDTLGLALGYGIARKPERADRCVFMHKDGHEVVAVLADEATEPAVRAALAPMAAADFRIDVIDPLPVVRWRIDFWKEFFNPPAADATPATMEESR